MENISIEKKTTAELIEKLVETKISRTELTDLIISRVQTDLDKEVNVLEREQKILKEKQALTSKDLMPLLKQSSTVEVDLYEGYSTKGYTRVRFEFHVPTESLPAKRTKHKVEIDELSKKLSVLYGKRRKLSDAKQRARVSMTQMSLESSDAGRELLKAIDGLKEQVTTKLLLSAGSDS